MNTQEVVKKSFWKSKQFLYTIAILMVIGFIVGPSGSEPQQTSNTVTQPVSTTQPQQEKAPTISKDDTMKEFQRLMELSKQSGLVTSYEMDENTSLKIYVGKIWYGQEVQFKKDMIAKFSTLQQTIYGRHRLEVRDAYSNEKVAEVTAFSDSLEVYK